jgi:arylsulfatase A-like enzyme
MNVQNKPTQPNVVLIILDTLRADRMSCYGYGRETTPFIDAFAEEATLFERAVVPGQWTIPSHASLFTGEYPTTHMTTQIYDTLGEDLVTLAELLHDEGFKTAGFCNNPLLGVVDNKLDRGFEEFYNYGGAVPNYPDITQSRPKFLGQLLERYTRIMRAITAPLQNKLAHNSLLLRLAMHPLIVPLWQDSINFKGNTKRSLRDVVGYLRAHRRSDSSRPLFTFINLMETHLPYRPPARFIQKFAPYYEEDREAQKFMRNYNLEHYRWMIPLTEPLSELSDRTLNDLYDAEVAYEDRLLRRLLKDLNKPEVRDNTVVIITADHGEGLNNHDFVGHSLVAYDDLVRVPLIVRYPRLYPAGERVSTIVSTRRVFHSILEAAAATPNGKDLDRAPIDVEGLSLSRALNGSAPQEDVVFAEAYTPDTLLALMENENPAAIDTFRCRSMRRAAYEGRHKLITVGDAPDELFNVIDDPGETRNLLARHPDKTARLADALGSFVKDAEARRPANWEAARRLSLDDKEISERLRALGYIE